MQTKLRPYNDAKISFPGFQRIGDFTSAGSESSYNLAVNGDTDLEYCIYVFNGSASDYVQLRLNNDSGNNYGRQNVQNVSGTITANRTTAYSRLILGWNEVGASISNLLTPSGFVKTLFNNVNRWSSGTTMDLLLVEGSVYNSTNNITSLNFSMLGGGNFTTGTRITVYKRVS